MGGRERVNVLVGCVGVVGVDGSRCFKGVVLGDLCRLLEIPCWEKGDRGCQRGVSRCQRG